MRRPLRVALLADVHSNLEALEACLEHAREVGAGREVFLGDLVGYGADPGPVLDRVAERVARGAVAVRGNHDEAVLGAPAAGMHEAARRAVEWTRGRLTEGQRAFLASLGLMHAEGQLLFVHASADAPEEWPYVSDVVAAERCLAAAGDARWVFCGHVHEPLLFHAAAAGLARPFRPTPGVAISVPGRRRWVALPGSVGQPRDGNAAACYAVMDTEAAMLTFHRVPYDWQAAAAKVRAAGLPESLARRLERGS